LATIAEFAKQKSGEAGKIIALGSGKGGVGKTVICASLGTGLAMLEKEVVIVDADFGSPTLHKLFGVNGKAKTYADFYCKKVDSLDAIKVQHPEMENLHLIVGSNGNLDIANMPFYQRMRFIRRMMDLEADYVLVDLGAGNNYCVLDLFLAADSGVVVVTPDTLSVLNGFHFLKNAFYRKLLQTFKVDKKVHQLIVEAEGKDHHTEPSVIVQLLERLKKKNRVAHTRLKSLMEQFKPSLIINGYTSSEDEIKGLAVVTAAKKLLNIHVRYLGYQHYDKSVPAAVKEGMPFIMLNAKSRVSRDCMRILKEGILEEKPGKASLKTFKQISGKLTQEGVNPTICTYDCQFWELCEFKKGGFPCVVRKL